MSPRLVVALRDLFPDSTHVENMQLRGCDDARVWAAARNGGYMRAAHKADALRKA